MPELSHRPIQALDLVAQLREPLRRGADAGIGCDGPPQVVERALEGHELGLEQLELHGVDVDLVQRIVRRREELDVRVEDAQRVDRWHQLRDLLLQ